MNTNVEIDSGSIRWNIIPIVKDAADCIEIELQWGWTAGMSEEDMKNYAEDAPSGYNSVTTTLDMAKELRDKLNIIIEQHEVRSDALYAESQKRLI